MRLVMMVVVLLLAVTPLAAEIYSWRDSAGVVHYTDDPAAVPKKYRTRTKAPQPPAEAPVLQPAPAPVREGAEPAVPRAESAPAAAPAALPPPDAGARYGARSVAEWQAEFRRLKAELKRVEGEQEQVRRDGGDGKKLLSRPQADELNRRSRELYEQYEALRLQYNRLVEQANQAGLSRELIE